jgi:CubicO group peptidase (beta-lactamase class C family)
MEIKKFLITALLVGGVLGVSRALNAKAGHGKPTSYSKSYDAVDAYIEEQMQRLHIPGASLAIVEGEQIVHLRGFGHSRQGGEMPTPQTPFFIGSLTKSITALAVMQLVEAGKIELDTPVQHYLPWFRVADPQASAKMTVHHLLNQTSGLPLWPSEVALDDFDNSPDATERQARGLSTLNLKRQVGVKWEYSNYNFNLLGLIIETVSMEKYADYLQKHIFNPLGMTHTFTSKAEAKQHGLAMGYRHWFSLPFPAPDLSIPRSSLPSGQLISSAEDMAHYLITHLNGGRYGEAQILSSAGIDELHRGVAECITFGISTGKYGMGWFEMDLGQTKTFSHGGNVPDFSAFMALVPEQKKAAVILFNADPYGLPMITEEIGMGMTAVLAGQQAPPNKLEFIQWIMRLLPLIPLLQIVGVFATLQRISQWRRNPGLQPAEGHICGQHILLPLIPNLTLAALLVYLQSSGLIRFLHLFMPDIAWIARISGGFASVWAIVHTGLMLDILRKPRA